MNEAKKKILIVEDDLNIADIYSTGFENKGFSVFLARDGQEGLDVAQKEKPDLIVLDILMPKMNGIEMAKKMKEDNIDIPIIFLTNYKDTSHINKVLELGAFDYIIKSDLGIEAIIDRVKQKLNI